MSYQGFSSSDRIIKTTRPKTGDYTGRHNPVYETDSDDSSIILIEPRGRHTRVDESNNGSDSDDEYFAVQTGRQFPLHKSWSIEGSDDGKSVTGFTRKSNITNLRDSDDAESGTYSIAHTGKQTRVDEISYGSDADGESETDVRCFSQLTQEETTVRKTTGGLDSIKEDWPEEIQQDVRRLKQHTKEETIVRKKASASDSLKEGGLKKKKHKFKVSRWFRRSTKNVAEQVKPEHTIESRSEEVLKEIQEDIRLLKQHSQDETIVRTKAAIKEAYPYDITVTTGDNENAGTTANVFIKLIGENNLASEKLSLPRGKFDSGKSHKFHKVLPVMLSPLTSVIISHDNSGESPDWYCEQVEVYSHTTGFKQAFPCQIWLQKNDDQHTLVRELFENTELTAFKTGESTSGMFHKEDLNTYNGVFSYDVTIVTGKKVNAGTNAQVYINFHGKHQTDVKMIKIPEECRPRSFYRFLAQLEFAMEYIEVGHDNTGTNPHWFCDHVTAYCHNTGLEQKFRCKHWLSKTIGDGLIKRRLYTSHEFDNKGLQRLCKEYGRLSTEVEEACNTVAMQLLACSTSFKKVWPVYEPSEADNIVFVVVVEKGCNTRHRLTKSLTSFDIVYRKVDEASNEENEIHKIETTFFSGEQKKAEDELVDVLKKSSKKLMESHSNLTMISASPVKSRYFANGPDKHKVERKPCIVFYVGLKGLIPIRENPVPTKLGTYVTDVREGVFKLLNDNEDYLARLKIGCSVGENTEKPTLCGTGGTLGAFVDLPNGKVGCITSAHTLFSIDKLIEFRNENTKRDNPSDQPTIYQPAPLISPINDKTPFGFVSSAVYKKGGDQSTGVEVGVITITDQSRNPENGKFPKDIEGFTEEDQPDYTSGEIYTDLPNGIRQFSFCKYGAITGFTRGAFKLEGAAVKTSSMNLHPSCELHNQLEILSVGTEPFAKPGDSGALVLMAPDNDPKDMRAIGILTGGTTSCTMFFVTPIWEVLKALNLPLRLKNFSGPTPMITDNGIGAEDVQLREIVTQTNLNEKLDQINTDIDKKIEQVNVKFSKIESEIKENHSEVKENFSKMFTFLSANMTNNNT